MLQLDIEHRRLDRVEPCAESDVFVMVAPVLPVNTEHPHLFRQGVIVGQHRAAVPETAQGLGREEAGGVDIAPVDFCFSFVGSSEGLGTVDNHLDGGRRLKVEGRRSAYIPFYSFYLLPSPFYLINHRPNFIQIAGLAVEADRDDRLGSVCYSRFDFTRIDVVSTLIDIDEDRLGPQQCDGLRGGDKSERGCDHLIPRADLQCHHGQQQGIRTAGTADGMGSAGERLEPTLQFPDRIAHDITGLVQNGIHLFFEFGLVTEILFSEIGEVYGFWFLVSDF